jgi:hypothetical protein
MNDGSEMLMKAEASKKDNAPHSRETSRTSDLDEEFHEFFTQGDVGNYEGGVAHTQPPSKLQLDAKVPSTVIDGSRQRVRRAFLTRVVVVIVTACAVLLVTAARFARQSKVPGETRLELRAPVAQEKGSADTRLSNVVREPQNVSQPPVIAAAPPPAPEITEPLPSATADERQVDESTVIAESKARGATVASASVAPGRRSFKPRTLRPRRVASQVAPIAPITPSTPAAVRKSVAAFPVD